MSKLIFIRHAQASYMAKDYDNLSDFGIEQSKTLGRYLDRENIFFDRVFVGPLKRHRQTYEHCYSQISKNQIVEPTFLDGLKEHHGPDALKIMYDQIEDIVPQAKVWRKEGKENPKVHKRNSLRVFRIFMQKWMTEEIVVEDPSVVPFKEWQIGVHESLEEIKNLTQSGETVGIFTSGGTKGAVIASCLGITDGVQIANLNDSIRNTSMSHFNYSKEGGFNILSFNEIPHLTKEQITFV